jgi:hypothetical protein
MTWNYERIKAIARETDGVNIGDLCALAPKNDAFYTGRPAALAAARWFADLWDRFGYARGVHLRRVHYQIVSQDPPLPRPNGEPYQNTEKDWGYLCSAGKWARYLGLVSCDAFVDRRNPDAHLFTNWRNPGDDWWEDPTPRYEVGNRRGEWDDYRLPDLPELARLVDWLPDLPDFEVSGYRSVQQAYHLEIWIEKSTLNDVLIPLCQRYNANLVTGAGEMSITAVVDFMHRVRDSRRPARILYVSDYDPAGLGMPISVARKIEFFQRNEGDDNLDIRLQAVILTREQVAEYDLPRVPVKDTDLRKAGWEAHHGQGQVELDALEALHPGELRRIVEDVILTYYDPTLEERAENARREMVWALEAEHENVLNSFTSERERLEADYDVLQTTFGEVREEFDALVANFQDRITANSERLETIVGRGRELYNWVADDLRNVTLEEDDARRLPEPDLLGETDATLYDSRRDYLDQLTTYKAYRDGQ